MSDWELVEDHTFVGMDITSYPTDRDTTEGEIVGIWTHEGTPTRFDVDVGDDQPLNIARDRVEVGG